MHFIKIKIQSINQPWLSQQWSDFLAKTCYLIVSGQPIQKKISQSQSFCKQQINLTCSMLLRNFSALSLASPSISSYSSYKVW